MESIAVFVMHNFLSLQGVPVHSLRFLFDGRRINDDETPKAVSSQKCSENLCGEKDDYGF